jgi:hypothetical protein
VTARNSCAAGTVASPAPRRSRRSLGLGASDDESPLKAFGSTVTGVERVNGHASDKLGQERPQGGFAIEEVHADNPRVDRKQRADLAVNGTACFHTSIDEGRVVIEERLHGASRRRSL